MSNTRYLELNSAYRNRNDGPTTDGLATSPANFVVQISSSRTALANAYDPVSTAAPKLAWNNSFRETAYDRTLTLANPPILVASGGTLSGRTTFILDTNGGDTFRSPDDFYNGAVLTLTGAATTPVVRRITDYHRIAVDQAIVTVDVALPDGFVPTGGTIDDPTGSTATAGTTPIVFIPSAPSINNYYAGDFLHDLISNEYVQITSYDGTTHTVELANVTAAEWQNTDRNFVIVQTRATISGNIPINDLVGNTIGGISADGAAIQLSVLASTFDSIYTNSFLRLGQPAVVFGTAPAPYGEQVRITDYTALDGVQGAGSAVGAIVLSTGVAVDDAYTGLLLTIDTTGGGGNALETREITSYVGATQTATVNANYSAVSVGSDFFIRTVEVTPPLSTTTLPATVTGVDNTSPGTFEITPITSDNYSPINFTGSEVSSQQMCCYEIELLNLILPNSTLANGGRIAFYPYVYVLLENVGSASGRAPGLIWSNNPHSKKKMFRAVCDDNTTPLISPFVKIDGDGMVQTVKFKPNDTFRFAVFLPDGTLFATVEQDTVSPNPTNGLVQCSAAFSLKKL